MRECHSHIVLHVCLAFAFVVTCLVGVLYFTAVSRGGRWMEGFMNNSDQWPLPEDLQNHRGEAFATAGLSQLYTSNHRHNHLMFLNPSVGDVARTLGRASTASTTDQTLETLIATASEDTVFPHMCSRNHVTIDRSSGSMGEASKMRVLDAMYVITRMCIRLPVVSSEPLAAGDRAKIILSIQPDSPFSCLFALLRPMFMSMGGSSMFKVNLLGDGDTRSMSSRPMNDLVNFDSSREDTPLRVVLTRVTDPLVAATVDSEQDRYLVNGLTYVGEADTFFDVIFARCTGEMAPIRAEDPSFGKVLTMYFVLAAEDGKGNKSTSQPGLSVQDRMLIRIRGPEQSLEGTLGGTVSDPHTFTLKINERNTSSAHVVTLSVDPSSIVVVILSDDTLVMAMMSPSRVTMKTTITPMQYRDDDYGGRTLINKALDKARATIPLGLSPYSNKTIPNLADIAFRTKMYPIRAFQSGQNG